MVPPRPVPPGRPRKRITQHVVTAALSISVFSLHSATAHDAVMSGARGYSSQAQQTHGRVFTLRQTDEYSSSHLAAGQRGGPPTGSSEADAGAAGSPPPPTSNGVVNGTALPPSNGGETGRPCCDRPKCPPSHVECLGWPLVQAGVVPKITSPKFSARLVQDCIKNGGGAVTRGLHSKDKNWYRLFLVLREVMSRVIRLLREVMSQIVLFVLRLTNSAFPSDSAGGRSLAARRV